jgi:prepilin-type N-terminal cleavage/methylation domain-containing protein/prepilin-type processing-associated H-X9-DG protein
MKMDIVRMSRRAFTLVELLVVIAIIALLLSILMPALNKVREGGKCVLCQSNLKQQALAANLYAQDNDDAMMCYQRGRNIRTDVYFWATDICPYIGNMKGAKGINSGDWLKDQGRLDKVLKIFICPSQREKIDGLNWHIRYAVNLYVTSWYDDTKDTYKNYKRSSIKRPGERIMFGDSTDNTNRNVNPMIMQYCVPVWRHIYSLSTENNPGAAFIPPADRHRDSNFTFVDGSVQKMQYKYVQPLDNDSPGEKDRKEALFNCRWTDRVR